MTFFLAHLIFRYFFETHSKYMQVARQHLLTKLTKYCVLICFNTLTNFIFLTLSLKLLVPFNFAIFELPFHTSDVLTILLPHTYINCI